MVAGDVRQHRPTARLGTLELRGEPTSGDQRQIGAAAIRGARPHPTGGLVGVVHRAELAGVVPGGVGDHKASDEAMRSVDADMVLVAEHRDGDLAGPLALRALGRRLLAAGLNRPAPVAVDLPGSRLRPSALRVAVA